jgi:hypothetical protein
MLTVSKAHTAPKIVKDFAFSTEMLPKFQHLLNYGQKRGVVGVVLIQCNRVEGG